MRFFNYYVRPALLPLLLIVILGGGTHCCGQFACGTPDPAIEEAKADVQSISNINMSASGLIQPYEIPIHLIVLNDDDGNPPASFPVERMQAGINGTNAIFDGLMSFYLCEVTLINNSACYNQPVNGGAVTANLFPAYNRSNAVNVYLAKDPGTTNEGAITGLAIKLRANGPEHAGILLKATDSGTMAHELGHYFGLFHTHQFTTRTNPNIILLLPS